MDQHVEKVLRFVNAEAAAEIEPASPGVEVTHSADAELLDAYSRAVIEVVRAVRPAVVSISVGKPSTASVPEEVGAGSGVVIAPDGYILTNYHVIHGSKRLSVGLPDGSTLPASVVGEDQATDLAVIRAEASGHSPVLPGQERNPATSSVVTACDCVRPARSDPVGAGLKSRSGELAGDGNDRDDLRRQQVPGGLMQTEMCPRCKVLRTMEVSISRRTVPDPAGKKRHAETRTYHCTVCHTFVRSEDSTPRKTTPEA